MQKKSSRARRSPPYRRTAAPALRLPRNWVPLGFSCLFAGALGTTAGAQEALQSALSFDAIRQTQANAPTESPPGQPHLGPVQLTLGAVSGVSFNDNINLSQNDTQSDTILNAGLNLGAVWPATQQSQLNFSTLLGYDYYLYHPVNNYVNIAPGSVLNWNFLLDEWTLTLYDQFSYTRSVSTVASVSNTTGIPLLDNTIGLRAQWQPEHWQVQLGYSYNNNISDAAAYDYLTSASDYLFAQGAWRFANATQLGLEASTSITQYTQKIQPNNTSYSLGPYLQWQLTKAISNSLRGGWTYYSFDATPGQRASTLSSYYFGLDLTHQLTEFVSQTLSAQRSVSAGINSGSAYNEQLTVNYGVNWSATPWLHLGLNLSYEKGQQPANQFSFNNLEHYDRYGISPAISYQITKKLSGSLSYSFWDKNSNINGNSYKQDTLNLQLQYAF